MATTPIGPTAAVNPGVVSGTTPVSAADAAANAANSTGLDGSTIAGNFQTFLTLLTTQLKNQDPLSPLDTNQFTQQLVQFAGIEQQMKGNDALASLVSIDKSAQSTQALVFVGQTVTVDGSTAQFDGNNATWSFNSPSAATATVTITSSSGQTAYSGPFSVNAGTANFTWDGKGTDGTQWPAGSYKMSVVGADSSGKAVAISTQVQGIVDSVDLTQSPPLLSVGGQNYTTDQVKRIVRAGATTSSTTGTN
jgi:flagellar basal-body rod modification protein FlgD